MAAVTGRAALWMAALGFGCAIATASPAWASPDDSAAPSAGTGSHSSSAKPARHTRSAKHPGDADSPSASQRFRQVPSAPRLPRTDPDLPQSPATPLATADTGPSPSGRRTAAPTAAASARQGMKIIIFKGTHFSLPRQTTLFVRQVSGDATFTDNSIYDLHNVDQYDWNKLTGITFTPLRPDTDAIMVAWRYNLTTQMFEIGPYYNSDLARIMPTESEIISVPLGEKFDFALDYHGITLTYGDQTVYKPLPEGLVPRFWSSERISSWFGGTSVAPKTISYYLRLDRRSAS